MTCKTYEKDLLLLAHGQLDDSDAARVRKHLSLCTPCNERLTQLAGVSLLLADAVHFAPSFPTVLNAPPSSFLPAKQQWLLSAFLGGCILFALLSLMKTAQSYAAPLPGMARILPLNSASAPSDYLSAPPCEVQVDIAYAKARQKATASNSSVPTPAAPTAKF